MMNRFIQGNDLNSFVLKISSNSFIITPPTYLTVQVVETYQTCLS
jgi:hypothetical protein